MVQDNIKEMLQSYYSMSEEERSKIDINAIEPLKAFVNLPDDEKARVSSEMGLGLPFKKKVPSGELQTVSENTTPSPSTSTSEIPTVQVTDGEIDAAPLNRPSTMPYGVKMDDEGKITSDLHKTNIQKRAEALKNAAAKTFQDNPELFSDYQNRDAYFNRILKYYKGDDYWKVKSEIYKADPRFTEQKKQEVISGAITNIVDPTGGFVSGAIKGAKEGVSHGADQISRSSKLLSSAKTPYDIATGITGEVDGAASIAMGAANLFVPELAAFTIGSKEAEEKAPGISNILVPINYVITEYYKDKGEDVPELASNLGALGDLALPILFGVGGKKIAKKFEGKPISKEILEEAIKETPKEDIDSAIENVIKKDNTDNSDGVHNANSVLMEEANSLSYQAEILKADLEKAKGTIAEPVIAQKIEELNAKINEVHGKEVERQTAEAHTLSTLDHLQKQREELVAQKATLSSEGRKALEPEIQKVDGMIKEIDPEEIQRQMLPITDKMAEIEIKAENEGIKIDFDYDNEISVTDKDGNLLNPEDMPESLRESVGVYEDLTRMLGEFSDADFVKSLDDSRRRIRGEEIPYEEVKKGELPDNVAVPFRYKLIEADQLQPSHLASGEKAEPAKGPKVAEVVQPVEVRVEPVVKGERVEGANKDKGSAINEQISWTGDIVEIKRSIKESDSNKFREIQETTSESVKQKRMDNLSPEELRIEKNYGEIIKQLKERGLLEGPCI